MAESPGDGAITPLKPGVFHSQLQTTLVPVNSPGPYKEPSLFKPVQIGLLSLANENISNKQAPSFKKEEDELRQKDVFDYVTLAVDREKESIL